MLTAVRSPLSARRWAHLTAEQLSSEQFSSVKV
jgi:hypothetical protein